MFIPFNKLPENAKIWIYPSSRPLTVEEQEYISASVSDFINGWQAHGQDLNASFHLFYNRFLVIGVDEGPQNATGCSIDASVHTLEKIQKELNINLFDRMSVSFKDDNGMVVSTSRSEFKEMIAAGDVDENTTVFNNMVTTKVDFDTHWEVNATNSWHARMFTSKV